MSARRRAAAPALLVCAVAALASAQAAPLAVCLAHDNPPYSRQASDDGFDREIAAAVAATLQREFVPVWYANETTIQEIEESDFPNARLARGACDAIFSMPGPASVTLADAPALALGAAYYGAAFELVTCAAAAPSDLSALRGRKLAIQSQSVAHVAARRLGALPVNYFSLPAALAGVARGEADAGLLWGPALGWSLAATRGSGDAPTACHRVEGYTPPAALRWNLHVATRAADAVLRADIDRALGTLQASGRLAAIAARYALPLHPAFATTYSPAALAALARKAD